MGLSGICLAEYRFGGWRCQALFVCNRVRIWLARVSHTSCRLLPTRRNVRDLFPLLVAHTTYSPQCFSQHVARCVIGKTTSLQHRTFSLFTVRILRFIHFSAERKLTRVPEKLTIQFTLDTCSFHVSKTGDGGFDGCRKERERGEGRSLRYRQFMGNVQHSLPQPSLRDKLALLPQTIAAP